MYESLLFSRLPLAGRDDRSKRVDGMSNASGGDAR
jgi:hypothetical protein